MDLMFLYKIQQHGNLVTNKFKPKYIGIFVIKSIFSNGLSYVISKDKKDIRAHYSQLKPWISAPSYINRCEKYKESLKRIDVDIEIENSSDSDIPYYSSCNETILTDSSDENLELHKSKKKVYHKRQLKECDYDNLKIKKNTIHNSKNITIVNPKSSYESENIQQVVSNDESFSGFEENIKNSFEGFTVLQNSEMKKKLQL